MNLQKCRAIAIGCMIAIYALSIVMGLRAISALS